MTLEAAVLFWGMVHLQLNPDLRVSNFMLRSCLRNGMLELANRLINFG